MNFFKVLRVIFNYDRAWKNVQNSFLLQQKLVGREKMLIFACIRIVLAGGRITKCWRAFTILNISRWQCHRRLHNKEQFWMINFATLSHAIIHVKLHTQPHTQLCGSHLQIVANKSSDYASFISSTRAESLCVRWIIVVFIWRLKKELESINSLRLNA